MLPLQGLQNGRLAVAMILALALTGCGMGVGRHGGDAAQERRQEVVDRIVAGMLSDADGDGRIDLPADLSSASVDGSVSVDIKPLMVFFLTRTFFSPDPYCGYEYTEAIAPAPDPLFSGINSELEDLGGGWYWLCAT